jgi:hypothetical protein
VKAPDKFEMQYPSFTASIEGEQLNVAVEHLRDLNRFTEVLI